MKLRQLLENSISIEDFEKEMLIKQIQYLVDQNIIRGKWILRKDNTLDVDGDVIFTVSSEFTSIPVKFGTVSGDFSLSGSNWTSLKNCPNEVGGTFSAGACQKITSLEGAPQFVGGNLSVAFCALRNLAYFPKHVGASIHVQNNRLTSLIGLPTEVDGNVDVSFNNLSDLSGSPRIVSGTFYAHFNRLMTLKGGPKEVGGRFFVTNNKLKNLKYAPKFIGGNFVAIDNPIEDDSHSGLVNGELFHDKN